jgi:hypothetical protein
MGATHVEPNGHKRLRIRIPKELEKFHGKYAG